MSSFFEGAEAKPVAWGGTPVEHGYAQEDFWRAMLEFLEQTLGAPAAMREFRAELLKTKSNL